jgi:hypothetical protein
MALKTIEWDSRRTRALLEAKFGVSYTLAVIKHFWAVAERLNFASDRIASARTFLSNDIAALADIDELGSAMFGASELQDDFNDALYKIRRELVGALHDIHCTLDCLSKGIAKIASLDLDSRSLRYSSQIRNQLIAQGIPLSQAITGISQDPAFKHLSQLNNESKHSAVISVPLLLSADEYGIVFEPLVPYPRVDAFKFLESVIDLVIGQLKVAGEEINQYLESLPNAA